MTTKRRRRLELQPSRLEYEMSDASGYGFTIVSTFERHADGYVMGWRTEVKLTTSGHRTALAGVRHLRHSAEAFLRQLAASNEPVAKGGGQSSQPGVRGSTTC